MSDLQFGKARDAKVFWIVVNYFDVLDFKPNGDFPGPIFADSQSRPTICNSSVGAADMEPK